MSEARTGKRRAASGESARSCDARGPTAPATPLRPALPNSLCSPLSWRVSRTTSSSWPGPFRISQCPLSGVADVGRQTRREQVQRTHGRLAAIDQPVSTGWAFREAHEIAGLERILTLRVGKLGADRFDGTVVDLELGEGGEPYHSAYGREKWLLVLAGPPSLPTRKVRISSRPAISCASRKAQPVLTGWSIAASRPCVRCSC